MILGYLVTSSVLVVSVGRLGDMFGRVKMYNLGFVIYTLASLFLTIDWMTGHAGACWLLDLADRAGRRRRLPGRQLRRHPHRRLPVPPARAGPRHQQRGRHQRHVHRAGARRVPGPDRLAAGLPGLRPVRPLRHHLGLPAAARPQRADPRSRSTGWATSTFAVGLVLVMVGITHGIQPYGTATHGLDEPDRDRAAERRRRHCWPRSGSSRRRSRYPMFRLACSGSRPSRSARSPPSCPRWAAAG